MILLLSKNLVVKKKDIINDNGENVCKSCGSIQGYKIASEYIDFYENKIKIVRKSVYYRKYHVQNTINNICKQYNLQILNNDRNKIYKVFEEINRILPQINDNRKRMISTRYILRRLFRILKLDYKNIEITKSKKTLTYYNQYWKNVKRRINSKIVDIILQ